jgi:hypothetical protein
VALLRTAADGSFRVVDHDEHAPRVVVRAVGREPAAIGACEWAERTAGPATTGTWRLRRSPGVGGRVVTEGGAPLTGVEVTIRFPHDAPTCGADGARHDGVECSTLADPDGAFFLSEAPFDVAFVLVARFVTRAPVTSRSIVLSPTELAPRRCDVVAPWCTTVRGVVSTPWRTPRNATAPSRTDPCAAPNDDSGGEEEPTPAHVDLDSLDLSFGWFAPCVDCNADGRFEIADVPEGRFRLVVQACDAVPVEVPLVVAEHGAPLPLLTIELAPRPPPLSIEGRVTGVDGLLHLDDEARVTPSISVQLDGDTHEELQLDGSFRFEDVAPGRHVLELESCAGWWADPVEVVAGDRSVVIPADRATGIVRARLVRRPVVRDAERDEDEPSLELGGDSGSRQLDRVADDVDEFEVDPVEPGTYDLVVCQGRRRGLIRSLSVRRDEVVDLGTVELPAIDRRRGRVTRRDGTPVADAKVTLLAAPTAASAADGSDGFVWLSEGPSTDAQGEFEVESFGGALALEIVPKLGPAVVVRLDRFPASRLVDVQIDRGASLRGRVVNRRDEPLAGVAISAIVPERRDGPKPENWDRVAATAVTDELGRYDLADVPFGECRIDVQACVGRDSSAVEVRKVTAPVVAIPDLVVR